jgi:hypothetical protein
MGGLFAKPATICDETTATAAEAAPEETYNPPELGSGIRDEHTVDGAPRILDHTFVEEDLVYNKIDRMPKNPRPNKKVVPRALKHKNAKYEQYLAMNRARANKEKMEEFVGVWSNRTRRNESHAPEFDSSASDYHAF